MGGASSDRSGGTGVCQRDRSTGQLRGGRGSTGIGTGQVSPSPTVVEKPIHRRAARYAWALLLTRIYDL
jgi:hypothetical protein